MFLRNLEMSVGRLHQDDNPLHAEYRRLQLGAHCVTDLYLRHLTKYETGETSKVVAEIAVDDNNEAPKLYQLLSVTKMLVAFPMDDYLGRDVQGKKRLVLHWVHEALLCAAERKGWERQPLQHAYDNAIAGGIKNAFFWKDGKAWTCPDRKIKARIFVDYDYESAAIHAVFFDFANHEIGRRLLVAEPATASFQLYASLGDCEWTSPANFRLKASSRITSLGGKASYSCRPPTLPDVGM